MYTTILLATLLIMSQLALLVFAYCCGLVLYRVLLILSTRPDEFLKLRKGQPLQPGWDFATAHFLSSLVLLILAALFVVPGSPLNVDSSGPGGVHRFAEQASLGLFLVAFYPVRTYLVQLPPWSFRGAEFKLGRPAIALYSLLTVYFAYRLAWMIGSLF